MSFSPITHLLRVNSVRVPAMFWCQNAGNESERQAIRWSRAERVVGGFVRWPAPAVLTDRATSGSPSVVGTGGNAVMAWQGKDADRRIWCSQSRPGPEPALGPSWGPQRLAREHDPTFRTTSFPTLARYATRTLMFWTDTSTPVRRMRWSELRDQRWMDPRSPEPGSRPMALNEADDGVAAAEHDGKLYVAYLRRSTGHILWRTIDRTMQESTSRDTGWRTRTVPALASDGVNLYVAWVGVEDMNIHWAILAGPEASPGERPVLRDRGTAGGPSLGVLERGRLVMTWVGIPGDPNIWWAEYRNRRWGPQQAFNDRWMNVPSRVSLA